MDMIVFSATPTRVEVVTSIQRRRRWTTEQKLEIVNRTTSLAAPSRWCPGNLESRQRNSFSDQRPACKVH